ncbi:hypothetical protein FB567DRAFT_158498 [Paraphoma chrysanthemicola]|uniref:DUF7730 domain-containing protein n=1 Tax=Paraphoma chrysanthemicola TaxID=798071 RepID=A0A8K0REA1_9PLEO|nr:hypothetical protein FB567DRAFT_158498 [Paraphoma chrysanthemicola]
MPLFNKPTRPSPAGQADNFNQIDLISKNSTNRGLAVGPSRLLSLPKELRLEIWQYVLKDATRDKLVLRVHRRNQPFVSGKRFCNSLYKTSQGPEAATSFEQSPRSPLGVGLLRTNHVIYCEALPILYGSVIFCIWDIEGIFPLFLERLSPFAQSSIRVIRLFVNQVFDRTSSIFYWALTCAQVARLAETLHIVEVQGTWPIAAHSKFIRRAILNPLVKLRVPKKFVNTVDSEMNYEDDFQRLLGNAAQELEAKADLRRALTTADMLERQERENIDFLDGKHPLRKRQKMQELPTRGGPSSAQQHVIPSDEGVIARDLAAIPGIDHFWQELLEWDMVSARSGSPTPPPPPNDIDDDIWLDNASTIAGEQQYKSSEDKDVDDWELVDKPSPL